MYSQTSGGAPEVAIPEDEKISGIQSQEAWVQMEPNEHLCDCRSCI